MSAVANDLQERIKNALKSGAREQAAVLRLLLAEVRKKEIDSGVESDDASFAAVVEKMIKQRRESVGHYERGGREDLAKIELAEIGVLSSFLPEQMSESEIRKAVDDAVAAAGDITLRDIGRVMGALKTALAGRADMSAVARLVKEKLAK